jgi:hypothetical protein
LSFSPGSSENIPARALFKVARKGKRNWFQPWRLLKMIPQCREAASSLSSINEAFILEL